ncbi:hypothetical protein DEO72_LG10g2435 [Vigna unguiculata]|uniref:Uncharacterized protein n=1 Tax=Vigna unguiculata TaxID=3917 RepID=A0A4D6NE95_VIGUN|nr:hypothetical protein DEO72_LG10g2435 [Vigna unguiculata]
MKVATPSSLSLIRNSNFSSNPSRHNADSHRRFATVNHLHLSRRQPPCHHQHSTMLHAPATAIELSSSSSRESRSSSATPCVTARRSNAPPSLATTHHLHAAMEFEHDAAANAPGSCSTSHDASPSSISTCIRTCHQPSPPRLEHQPPCTRIATIAC